MIGVLTLFALLYAVPVEAAIEYVDTEKPRPENASCMTWYTVTKAQHDCLAKMEQAMRQIDYYMDPKSKEPQHDILDALQNVGKCEA